MDLSVLQTDLVSQFQILEIQNQYDRINILPSVFSVPRSIRLAVEDSNKRAVILVRSARQ